MSIYHFGHQGRYVSSPSHPLDNPCKVLARDDLVLKIRLADGGAYNACNFAVGEITLALQFISLRAREIQLLKSVESGVANIGAGDERDLEIRLEWADDCARFMDHTGLPKSILHEITSPEREGV